MRKIKFVVEEQDRLDSVFGYKEIVLKMNDGNIYSCRVIQLSHSNIITLRSPSPFSVDSIALLILFNV